MKRFHQDFERRAYARMMVCEEEERINREIRELENITPPQRAYYNYAEKLA